MRADHRRCQAEKPLIVLSRFPEPALRPNWNSASPAPGARTRCARSPSSIWWTEGSIEHSILHLLGQKQALADGLLDGDGDLAALKLPSGRGAFIERMQAMMDATTRAIPRVLSPEQAFVAEITQRLGDSVLSIEARDDGEGRVNLLTVLDLDHQAFAAETQRTNSCLKIEFLDKAAWLAMRRLAATGLLRFTHEARTLYRSSALPDEKAFGVHEDGKGIAAMAEADRALRMAKVLAAGGFPEEARPLLAKSIRSMAMALNCVHGGSASDPAPMRKFNVLSI
jgi:hypothetical protein